MGEVLSQNEIDSLLNALNTGELDVEEYQNTTKEKKVRDYDFARPSKFSKDHLRTLEIIFEHYSRLISTTLPGYLRHSCSVEVINAEEIAYSEFSNALSNPVLIGIVDFSPLKGSIVMDMSTKIGYAVIDRLLGGKGEALEKERDFSEIELMIIERIMNVFVELLIEPWHNVVDVNPYLDKIETNSQFAQVISPTDMVALITINIKIDDVEGLLNICIPFLCVESVIDKLNTKHWFTSMRDIDEEVYNDVIERQISTSIIPIKTVLGKTHIKVNDFVNLQRGDIIKLDTMIEDLLDVYVGNVMKFKAKPGTHKKKNAIQIVEVMRKEDS